VSCRFHYLSSPCSHPPVTSCIHRRFHLPACSLHSDTVCSVRASHGRADHQQATPPLRPRLHPQLRLRPRPSLLLQRSSSLQTNNHCPFQTFPTSLMTNKTSTQALSAPRHRRSLHIQSARCTEKEERRAIPKNCWTRCMSCWTRSTPSSPSWPTTTKSKSIPALVRHSSPTHARPHLARFTTL